MAEVEDVSGAAGGGGQDLCDAGVEDLGWSEEGDRIEVALHGDGVVESAPGLIERGAPVEAEDIGGGLSHGGEERCGVHAEVDDGDAEGADAGDEVGGGSEDVGAVVGGGERADPGVEDLDDIGAGGDLLGGVVGEDGDELRHEDGPGLTLRAQGCGFGVESGAKARFRSGYIQGAEAPCSLRVYSLGGGL